MKRFFTLFSLLTCISVYAQISVPIDCANITLTETAVISAQQLLETSPDSIYYLPLTKQNADNLELIYCQTQDIENQWDKCRTNINIGVGYSAIKNDRMSVQVLEENLMLANELQDSGLLVDNHVFLCLAYLNLSILDAAEYHQEKFHELAFANDSLRWKADSYHMLGRIQEQKEDYKSAIQALETSLDYYPKDQLYPTNAETYSYIGNLYNKLGDVHSATKYIVIADELIDTTDLNSITRLEIMKSSVEINKGLINSAKKRLLKNLTHSQNINHAPSQVELSCVLAEISTEENLQVNIDRLEEAKELVKKHQINGQDIRIHLLLSQLYERKRNNAKAYANFKLYQLKKDSLNSLVHSSRLNWLSKAFEQTSISERNKAELIRKEQKNKIKLRNVALFGSLALLTLLSYLILKLRRTANTQKDLNNKLSTLNNENEKMMGELEQSKAKIEEANNTLQQDVTGKALYLSHKFEIIEKINNILGDKDYNDEQARKKISQILQIEKNASFWEDFDKSLKDGNQRFHETLAAKHPNLSTKDLRLCGLLKLNLNTKEIAALTYKTPESTKVARSRLRKKLGLQTGDKLNIYLNSL